MRYISLKNLLAVSTILLIQPFCYGATAAAVPNQPKDAYSPYASAKYPSKILWGDTHLHTTNSFDARALGVTLDPAEAYRFARGEEVISSTGQAVRLSRPLDFLVITDHSDGMGAIDQLIKGNKILLKDSTLKAAQKKLLQGGLIATETALDLMRFLVRDPNDTATDYPLLNETVYQSVWEDYIKTADQFNEPGRFTAMIGYEWTPASGGDKLHRNVLYRGDAKQAKQLLPFTALESLHPQGLWNWMQQYEDLTGSKVLALAHSGNLSNGKMFPVETVPFLNTPVDQNYVETRAKWEPLYEVSQIKGDSEAHPYLSPDDEFADFETWDRGNVTLYTLKEPDMLQYEYAREALKNGLALEQKLGTNPYRFGMVGSTDSHTSLATAEEDNFFGKFAGTEPNQARIAEPMIQIEGDTWQNWETSASGYAAVWATDNTRAAIFDAMQRREVYATSGPRITLRFFGGFGFTAQDAKQHNLAQIGYEKGVPMGGMLNANDANQAPTFLVAAQKDGIGANLDRVQIIKGWLDADGKTHEKIYNVAWSDKRKLKRNGKLAPVGNTVDINNARWSNSIGSASLVSYWQDPNFDKSEAAFYYVRVLEIPTPRWPVYDAKHFGTQLPEGAKTTIQERAYSTPIWYAP